MKKSKLTKIMLWLFFVPLVLDWIMTYVVFYVEGHTLSEANSLFVLLKGNHILFGLITLGICFLWYKLITRQSGLTYKWILLSVIVWLVLARGLAIYGHIQHLLTPVSFEVALMAQSYQPTAKMIWYTKFVALLIYLPIFMQWVTFRLFKIDHHIVRKLSKNG